MPAAKTEPASKPPSISAAAEAIHAGRANNAAQRDAHRTMRRAAAEAMKDTTATPDTSAAKTAAHPRPGSAAEAADSATRGRTVSSATENVAAARVLGATRPGK